MKHIWIIEVKTKVGWEPTDDASLIRKDARFALGWWKKNRLPDIKYRICKYIPSPEQFKLVDKEI